MLGTVQDAEDVVQETMLRWHTAERENIRQPEAWLVSVATRLSVDRLRRAATERVSYPGQWLHEPIADDRFSPDRNAEIASDLPMAFLVLLERLAPEERAAFLLREVFDTDYDEIARTLDTTPTAVRQIVHRARERIHTDRTRFTAPLEAKEQLFGRFIEALQADDKDGLLAVIADDATWVSDGGGKGPSARRMIHGSDRIARLLLGIQRKRRLPFTYNIAYVNGEPCMISYRQGELFSVTFCATDGDRMRRLFVVTNPDKLTQLR